MGYSLSMVNGKIVRSAQDAKEGDELITYTADGLIRSEVKK
jgi:exonuclease VII large subunit